MRVVAFLALLLPSLWFAWLYQDNPRFGDFSDDAFYFIGAKSIATGQDYRALSLPNSPYQTKYPPGYPAYLSAAWGNGSSFPDNIKQAVWLQWRMLPILLLLAMFYWTKLGFEQKWVWGFAALLACNPYMIFFSVMLMSEIPFTVFIVAALVALVMAEQRGGYWILAAGLAAGIAFLFRTAGIALLISAVPVFLWRKQWKQAVLFTASMLPFALGWVLWSKDHMSSAQDLITLYYTNYTGFHWLNFHWNEAHLFIWKNLDGLLYGIGALILPKASDSLLLKILSQVLGIAAISGSWRLVKERNGLHYGAFAVVFSAMLVLWSFPPNERFVLPLAPLLIPGFCLEMRELILNIRKGFTHKDSSQRVAAKIMSGLVATLLFSCLALQLNTVFSLMPQMMEGYRGRLARNQKAFAWMKANLPADAKVLADQDTLFYLYTNRQAAGLVIPTIYWYREDNKARVAAYSDGLGYARRHGLTHWYVTKEDFQRDIEPEDYQRIHKNLANLPGTEKLYDVDGIQLFAIR